MADKVLVTGGAGFIGSHVVDAMLGEGYEVVVIDSLVTGNRGNVNPDVLVLEADLRDPGLAGIFQEHKPRFVCHLAAQASITKSIRGPLVDADENIMGSLNVLEECRNNDVEKIVFLLKRRGYLRRADIPAMRRKSSDPALGPLRGSQGCGGAVPAHLPQPVRSEVYGIALRQRVRAPAEPGR